MEHSAFHTMLEKLWFSQVVGVSYFADIQGAEPRSDLANFGCKKQRSLDFVNIESFPTQLRGILKLDRLGIPSKKI